MPAALHAPAPATSCQISSEKCWLTVVMLLKMAPVPVADCEISRAPFINTMASGSMTHQSPSRSTHFICDGSIWLTQSRPSARFLMYVVPSSNWGVAFIEMKPSMTTTALEAPVTGLPQTSSLISRITRPLSGVAQMEVIYSPVLRRTVGCARDDAASRHRHAVDAAVVRNNVRTLDDQLQGVDVAVKPRGLVEGADGRTVSEERTRCVHPL